MMKKWRQSPRKQNLMPPVIKDFWQLHQDSYPHQMKIVEFHQEQDSILLDITDIIRACTIVR